MRLATSHSNMHGLVPLSPAVEGLDLEKISIEANFVLKEVEFFVEQHIQNQLKSTLGKISYWQLNFINFFLQYIMFDIICHTQDDPYHFQSFAQYLCLHTYKYQHKLKQNFRCVVYIDFNQIQSSLFYLENNLHRFIYRVLFIFGLFLG